MVFDATIKDYLKEIDEAPLLDWQQEKKLAKLVIEENDYLARDQLVRSNLRLVVNIAKKFTSRGMQLADLIEEGNLGLMRAVDSFDPEHKVRFSTYSSGWIKQSIKRALLSNFQPIHIPTYMVELVNQWRYTAAELSAQLGRPAKLEEVAGKMKLPIKKARVVQRIIEQVKAGFQGDSTEENPGLDDSIEDVNAVIPGEALASEEELAKAVDLLADIEPREAEVLSLRFGLDNQTPLTLKQIGELLGLTRERIRQIQRDALEKLNELMNE